MSDLSKSDRAKSDRAKPDGTVLDALFATVNARRDADPDTSWTAKLLAQGVPKAAQKTGEEAVEAIIAAVSGDPRALISESADLLYHLTVLWAASGVTPGEVWQELASREGQSGITEKAARKSET